MVKQLWRNLKTGRLARRNKYRGLFRRAMRSGLGIVTLFRVGLIRAFKIYFVELK